MRTAPTASDTRAGRDRMKARCVECALRHTPGTVRYVKVRSSLSGTAVLDPGGHWIAAPKPVTRKALCVFLHECAHIALGHCEIRWTKGKRCVRSCRQPVHVMEMLAEKQAIAWMREDGIPVPPSQLRRAKDNVARKIEQAKARGAKRVDPEALRFAGYGPGTVFLGPVFVGSERRLSDAADEQGWRNAEKRVGKAAVARARKALREAK